MRWLPGRPERLFPTGQRDAVNRPCDSSRSERRSRQARMSASWTASSAEYGSRRIRRATAQRWSYSRVASASNASWSPCCARTTSSDVTAASPCCTAPAVLEEYGVRGRRILQERATVALNERASDLSSRARHPEAGWLLSRRPYFGGLIQAAAGSSGGRGRPPSVRS
jgi:hypothetical protein